MHSPEPWSIYGKADNLVDGNGKHFLAVDGLSEIRGELRRNEPFRADLDRIVACVNFLAGVPTEVLNALLADEQRYLQTHGDQQANPSGYDPFPTKGSPIGSCRDHITAWYDLNRSIREPDWPRETKTQEVARASQPPSGR